MSHLFSFLSPCAKAQNTSENLYKLTNRRQQFGSNVRHTNYYISWHSIPQFLIIGSNPKYARTVVFTFPSQIVFITIYLSIIRRYTFSEYTRTSLERYEMEYDLGRKFWRVCQAHFSNVKNRFMYLAGFIRLYRYIFYETE